MMCTTCDWVQGNHLISHDRKLIFLIKIQTCQYTIKLYSQSESILSGLLLLTTFSWSVREVLVHGGALVVGANLGKKKTFSRKLSFRLLA